MPNSKFSEFSYGFAFTRELTEAAWALLPGAPELPDLYDEGHGKGYDVRLGFYGACVFVQFKRGFYATRSTALHWDDYGSPHFRFEIYPPSVSSQHADLLALVAAPGLNTVLYSAPAFHTIAQLNAAFLSRTIVERSRTVPVATVGALSPELHYVTYAAATGGLIVHSEPRHLPGFELAAWTRNARSDRREESDAPVLSQGNLQTDEPLDDARFAAIAEFMLELRSSRLSPAARDELGSLTTGMTSFGRARLLGRLLFDGELLPLPFGVA